MRRFLEEKLEAVRKVSDLEVCWKLMPFTYKAYLIFELMSAQKVFISVTLNTII